MCDVISSNTIIMFNGKCVYSMPRRLKKYILTIVLTFENAQITDLLNA